MGGVTRSWRRGFEAAKAASQNSIAPRHARKVGAALFAGSVLLSLGHNSYNHGHPRAGWNIHAEHRALLRRRHHESARGLTLYVYRELANGQLACCRPCENCWALLREAGVRVVRFVDEQGRFAEARSAT